MDEVWKEIPGTDYSVSDQGRVASRKFGKWRVMPLSPNRKGYLQVALFSSGMQNTRPVHQLVAEAFLGPRPTPKHQVNHKDGIKSNNRDCNLEWVTQSENQRHRFDVLKHHALHGEACGPSKRTEAEVREILRRRAAGETCKAIAADYGMDKSSVSDIARGKTWGWLA